MLSWQSLVKATCALLFAPIMAASALEIVSSHALAAEAPATPPPANRITNGDPGQRANRAVSPDVTLQADFDNGSTIYDNACSACHGETGQGGQDDGPALGNNLNLGLVMLVVRDGRNKMPSFDVFTDQELVDISTFVVERLHQ